MPTAPKRPCLKPGCGNLTERGYCDTCRPPKRRRPQGDYSDRRWRRFRKWVLTRNPLCKDCDDDGRVTPAEELHHIRKLSDGGAKFDVSNVRPLCKSCHSRRTARGE